MYRIAAWVPLRLSADRMRRVRALLTPAFDNHSYCRPISQFANMAYLCRLSVAFSVELSIGSLGRYEWKRHSRFGGKMIRCHQSVARALAGLLCIASPAAADTIISTTGGGTPISPFGKPDAQTFGQTFTAPVDNVLQSFTFFLSSAPSDVRFSLAFTSAPEPSTLSLVAAGIVALVGVSVTRRRRVR